MILQDKPDDIIDLMHLMDLPNPSADQNDDFKADIEVVKIKEKTFDTIPCAWCDKNFVKYGDDNVKIIFGEKTNICSSCLIEIKEFSNGNKNTEISIMETEIFEKKYGITLERYWEIAKSSGNIIFFVFDNKKKKDEFVLEYHYEEQIGKRFMNCYDKMETITAVIMNDLMRQYRLKNIPGSITFMKTRHYLKEEKSIRKKIGDKYKLKKFTFKDFFNYNYTIDTASILKVSANTKYYHGDAPYALDVADANVDVIIYDIDESVAKYICESILKKPLPIKLKNTLYSSINKIQITKGVVKLFLMACWNFDNEQAIEYINCSIISFDKDICNDFETITYVKDWLKDIEKDGLSAEAYIRSKLKENDIQHMVDSLSYEDRIMLDPNIQSGVMD